jgi:hypothetical protein
MHEATVLEVPHEEVKICKILAQEKLIFPNFFRLGPVQLYVFKKRANQTPAVEKRVNCLYCAIDAQCKCYALPLIWIAGGVDDS